MKGWRSERSQGCESTISKKKVCYCVCVCERDRPGKGEGECIILKCNVCACVCVCVPILPGKDRLNAVCTLCVVLQTDNVFEKSSRLSDWLQLPAWSRLMEEVPATLYFCSSYSNFKVLICELFRLNTFPSMYFHVSEASGYRICSTFGLFR